MHTQNKEGNYLENNISDPNLTDLFMQLWWPSSRECSTTPCLMQLFKRFTENSAMELYWCSQFCDANGEREAVSGKAPSLRPFDCRFCSICCQNEHFQMWTISWLTWFHYIITMPASRRHFGCENQKLVRNRVFAASTTVAHSWWEPDNAPTRPLRSIVVWRLHVARYQEGFCLSGLNTTSPLSHVQKLTRLSC